MVTILLGQATDTPEGRVLADGRRRSCTNVKAAEPRSTEPRTCNVPLRPLGAKDTRSTTRRTRLWPGGTRAPRHCLVSWDRAPLRRASHLLSSSPHGPEQGFFPAELSRDLSGLDRELQLATTSRPRLTGPGTRFPILLLIYSQYRIEASSAPGTGESQTPSCAIPN